MCGTQVKVPAAVKQEWQQQARANHMSAASALPLHDRPIGYTLDNEDRGISDKEAGKSQEAARNKQSVGCSWRADMATTYITAWLVYFLLWQFDFDG